MFYKLRGKLSPHTAGADRSLQPGSLSGINTQVSVHSISHIFRKCEGFSSSKFRIDTQRKLPLLFWEKKKIYIYIYLKSKPDSSWNLEHPVAHATCFSMDSDTDRYVRQPHWVHHAYLLNLQPSLIYWKKALFKIISITSIKTRHENSLPFVTIWMELEGMMLSEIRGKTNTAWPHL